MTDKELEKKVDQLFAKITPDVSEKILQDMDALEAPETGRRKKSRRSLWLRLGSLAAVFLLLLTGVGSYAWFGMIDSTVTLDVNPSIEICVNRFDRVLRAAPLNGDGDQVIGDMRLKHVDLDVAINALIGSMMKNGYLSEVANSILITVDGANDARSEALSTHLSDQVESILNTAFSGAVLSQTAKGDEATQALASSHSITVGKAQLIQELIELQPLYSFDELSKLTINELNVLLGKQPKQSDTLRISGNASTRAYIGAEEALSRACLHVGCEEAQAVLTDAIKLEFDKGRMVYDVEFRTDEGRYELDVDAITGEIVSFEQEQRPVEPAPVEPDAPREATVPPTAAPTASDIGAAKAKEIALAHAGVSASKATMMKCELDRDDGRMVYEVEFEAGGYEYEYDIDAATGKILKSEKERDDDAKPAQASTPAPKADQIGAARAKEIALAHAGVSASKATMMKCELDRDDGRMVYEVEFEAGGYEYEYDIDATTGKILKSEKERGDDAKPASKATKKPTAKPTAKAETTAAPAKDGDLIGASKAKSIALSHAGVSSKKAKSLKCSLDREDGKLVYEVEFKAGGYEYEYEIDAVSGKILSRDKEKDD